MNIKTRGFTLIELLVVVAIISLLSSVVLASVRESRVKAQASAQRTFMKEIVKALELYRTDYGDYPPTAVLSSLLSGPLSPYYKGTVTSMPLMAGTAMYDKGNSTVNCGMDSRVNDPYIIYYQLTQPNLNVPRLYNVTGSGGSSGSSGSSGSGGITSFYCASLSVN